MFPGEFAKPNSNRIPDGTASSAERLIQLYHAHLRPEIGRPHWEVEPAAGQKNSEGNWSDSAIRIRASVARTRIAANVGSWHFSDMALVLGDVRSWGAEMR